jgi:uncharacterized phage protein (TIGR01671 family)
MGKVVKIDLLSDNPNEHRFEMLTVDDEIIDCVPEDVVLMQSSGLNDKYGNDIYTKDILKVILPLRSIIGVVEFVRGAFIFRSRNEVYTLYEIFEEVEAGLASFEVLGNEFENLDILKRTC